MSSHNLLRGVIREAFVPFKGSKPQVNADPAPQPNQNENVLDGVTDEQRQEQEAAAAAAAANPEPAPNPEPTPEPESQAVFDSTSDPSANFADADISLKAVAAVLGWAETLEEDLDEGEGFADRLLGLLVGIADVDVDGELSEDEADIVDTAANAAWDYMAEKGVADEDLSDLFNEWDNEVGQRVHELLLSKLPEGEEAEFDDMDSFVFGDGSDEAVLDSAVLDATYRKKIVVRRGKKVRINKRVAGTVRLSAKQKVAVRKMLRKSHGAIATMRRRKSVRVRKQLGLDK